MGRFQRKLVHFVHDHGSRLERLQNVFLAVSLAAAHHSPSARQEVANTLARFTVATHWMPKRTIPVAGALLYTRYGFFTRLVMRLISKRAGGDTDTSRDYEYTDWAALSQLSRWFDGEVRKMPAPVVSAMCGTVTQN
jgi:menaquinone-dependent protoporphyrinogen oxidase